MQNLAGKGPHPSSSICAEELIAAGIKVVGAKEPFGEVGSMAAGELRGFTFKRAWYYWMVEGPMPIEQARALYVDPVGLEAVRVAGFAGNDHPDNHVEWFGADGKALVIDPDGEQKRDCERWAAKIASLREEMAKTRFIAKLDDEPGARGFVTSYHVDTQEGLQLLADTIRALPE